MNVWKPQLFLAGFLFFAGALLSAQTADAFGISPPHVINNELFPGAHFEQQITLSRTDPEQPVHCQVESDIPGFTNWVTFDPGDSFDIAAGQKIAVLNVKVDVPNNAKPGRRTGTLKITAAPAQETGKINIVLGAQIDVDLTVTSEKFAVMAVKQVKINDIEPGWKVKVDIKIENQGNTAIAPDRVSLDVYDSGYKNIIFSEHQDSVAKVKPFTTQEVSAYFPEKNLKLGQYWGDVKVYKGGDIAWEEKAIFTVQPKGTLPPQPAEPLLDVVANLPQWAQYAGIGAAAVLLLVVIFFIVLRIKKTLKPKKRSK